MGKDDDAKIVHVEKTQEGSGSFVSAAVEVFSAGFIDAGHLDNYQVTLDDGRMGNGATPESAAEDAKSK